MHATDLISLHIPETIYPSNPVDGICCVTGQQTLCLPKKDLIGDSFTDWSLCAAPSSPHVGVNVYRAWTYGTRAEGKKRDFCPERHACWYVSEREFRQVNRQEIRSMVLNGCPDKIWAGWVTTGYKKHGSLRSPVNTSKNGIWAFNESRPDCSDMERVNAWWQKIRGYQDAGIGRRSMKDGDAPPGVLKGIDMAVWMEFQAWSRDKRLSALYGFMLYLLPSKEELK